MQGKGYSKKALVGLRYVIINWVWLGFVKISLVAATSKGIRYFQFPTPTEVPNYINFQIFFRCQFYQHFTSSFFVQKCLSHIFFTYSLALHLFVKRTSIQKLLVVKCSLVVNFINILQAPFVPIFLCLKIQSKTVIR